MSLENAHRSAEVLPLTIRNSTYPATETSWERSPVVHPERTNSAADTVGTIKPPPIAAVVQANSNLSQFHEERAEFLDGSSSGEQSWDPVGAGGQGSTWNRRPASSVYADSVNFPHPGERVRFSARTGGAPSTRTSQETVFPPTESDNRGLKTMAARDFAGGVHTSQGGGSPPRNQSGINGGVANMSWLNLGSH